MAREILFRKLQPGAPYLFPGSAASNQRRLSEKQVFSWEIVVWKFALNRDAAIVYRSRKEARLQKPTSDSGFYLRLGIRRHLSRGATLNGMKTQSTACAQMDLFAFACSLPCKFRARGPWVSSRGRSRTSGIPQNGSFSRPLRTSPRMCKPASPPDIPEERASPKHSRRRVLSVGAASAAGLAAAALNATAATGGAAVASGPSVVADGLAQYRGPLSLGYEFSYPTEGWSVKKKPIKTHLSEVIVSNTAGRASSTAGVTVDAVKIAKIEDFGTPDDVGAKVVAVENKKDNVLSAALVSTRKSSSDGLTYFFIEYTVESGRGLKRYLAKATITGGNLYVFTAQAKVNDFDGIDGPVLASMVDSFHVTPQYV